ncbi:MAG: hypothetical protein K8R02_07525 [Anaerohalosphaeraceae bacterium]|nr:hypothetical protein [Anaerohalosphaeraceae bacterium]
MLKKIIALSIAFCLVLTVVGCKDSSEPTDQIEKTSESTVDQAEEAAATAEKEITKDKVEDAIDKVEKEVDAEK